MKLAKSLAKSLATIAIFAASAAQAHHGGPEDTAAMWAEALLFAGLLALACVGRSLFNFARRARP